MLNRSRVHAIARAVLVLLLAIPAAAQTPPSPGDLKLMSIEDLMRIDTSTAARRDQPVGTTAAAISVITGDDIRRSGVTTIADALLLADGVHVSRFNNGTWRISARGFNGASPNKLLVMVDGRTVYSPLFAGVFWNTLDYVLEDIDRIEVIRGPGTVLWGANAVNGVINIITRHSRDTLGTLVTFTSGNEDPGIAQVRYGARAGSATWRAYGKLAVRDAQHFTTGQSAGDGIRREQAGFRLDSAAGGAAWLLQGDAFHSRDDLSDRRPGEFTHLALQGRWSRGFTGGSRLDVQSYYRREYRRIPLQLTHEVDVLDIDLQHNTRWRTRHEIVWGGGVRANWDRTEGSTGFQFDPADRRYGVENLFVQDEIALLPGRLSAMLGVKYEHNSFSGGALQPNVRARLMMAHNQVLWAGASRAVRRPTRLDDDLIAAAPSGLVIVRGTHEFDTEKLNAVEAGYRVQPSSLVSVDATVFRHAYDDLRSQDAPVSGVIPLTIGNTLRGTSHGVELGLNLQPISRWRMHGFYTWIETNVERQAGSRDTTGGASETNDPEHLFTLRNAFDLPHNIELDALLRSIAALPNPAVPGFTELTVRAGWHMTPRVELSLTGQDLLHDSHLEAGPPTVLGIEFERAIRAGLTLRF